MKFAEAKAANPKLSIIDHLRDEQRGYGRWTLKEPGLPRGALHTLDEIAYRALYTWLSPDRKTGHRNSLPDDLCLPTRSETTRIEVGEEELRLARRQVRRMERHHARIP
jgi:hypothetical protein